MKRTTIPRIVLFAALAAAGPLGWRKHRGDAPVGVRSTVSAPAE